MNFSFTRMIRSFIFCNHSFCKRVCSFLFTAVFLLSTLASATEPTIPAPDASVTPPPISPTTSSTEKKLELKQVVTEIPESAKRSLKKAFSKEAIEPWLWILGTTSLLYQYDREILNESKRIGVNLDLSAQDKTETKFRFLDKDIFRLPSDKGSTLYFLGDGWTHASIGLGFFATGYFKDSVRPFNTGIQIFHSMFVATIFNQAIKRSTGRESPNQATSARGQWRFFPKIKDYGANSAKYDAMPSGHIMTATSVFTIVLGNYPEYGYWIKPVGAIWLTALGFQMMNNGVHWASDYPLGIAMGILYGKTALAMGKPEVKPEPQTTAFFPSITEYGDSMLNFAVRF